MNKAIRMAVAAAFGVAATMPALAETTARDVNSAAADSGRPPVFQDQFRSDTSAYDAYQRSGRLDGSIVRSSNEFGSPAGNMASDREIRLSAHPGNIGVSHGETVKFVMADGREFRWRFDTLRPITSFPLSSIAPENLSGRVYVNGQGDAG